MAKASEILQLHDSTTTEQSLVAHLGDGFLVARNPIYRRLRERMLELEFEFSHELPVVTRYVALSELCADEIFDLGIVPYVDNVGPLRHFAAHTPTATVSSGFLAAVIRRNFIMYDCGLALARHIVF